MRRKLRRHRILAHTLVWREGQLKWLPADAVPELFADLSPEAPPRSAHERIVDLPLAGPWRRFFARWLDLAFFGLILSWPVVEFLIYLRPEAAIWLHAPEADLAISLVVVPIALVAEGAFFALFGITPGKSILGIIVTTVDAHRLTALAYLYRQVQVYFRGIVLALPPVSMVGMAVQYWKLKKTGQTGYDRGRFNVKARPLSAFRIVVAAIIISIGFGGNWALQVLSQSEEWQFRQGFSWTNPATDITVQIPPQWTHQSTRNDEGDRVDFFISPNDITYVLFANEPGMPSMSLNAYAQSWASAIQGELVFAGPATPFQFAGWDAVKLFGHQAATPQHQARAILLYTRGRFWRIVVVQESSRPIPRAADQLEYALLASIR